MIVILNFIVIDSKTNESENNLNIHSLPASLECLSNLFFFPFSYSSNSLLNCLTYKEGFCLNEAASVKQMRLDIDCDIRSSA